MSEVRVETTRGIRTVTLADVENRNALGAGLINGLHGAIEEANSNPRPYKLRKWNFKVNS